MSKDAKRSLSSAAISLEIGKKVNWQESVDLLPAFHPWLYQFEATLVHGNIGFPIPKTERTHYLPQGLTSGKRRLVVQGTWCAPEQCSNPGFDLRRNHFNIFTCIIGKQLRLRMSPGCSLLLVSGLCAPSVFRPD